MQKHLAQSREISFVLVVDDFSVKYQNQDVVLHLMAVIGKKYNFTVDWTGSKYLGMTITCDEKKRALEITLSMPGYVQAALKRFQVIRRSNPTHSPAPFEAPTYGKSIHYVTYDNFAPISPAKTYIQEV